MPRQITKRQRSMPSWRACAVVCTFVCTALALAGEPGRIWAQAAPDEYQLKAAFIFHFAQMVEWPAGTFETGNQPLTLCLLNSEPNRTEIRGTVEGKSTGGRVVRTRFLDSPINSDGCNILFLSRSDSHVQESVLRSLRGKPVLTVGETDDFLDQGGMIRFHFDQDKIRFDVNLAAADAVHLKISSRLLLLATAVIRSRTASGG